MNRKEKEDEYVTDVVDTMPLSTKNDLIRSWYEQTVARMSDEDFEDLYSRHFGLS